MVVGMVQVAVRIGEVAEADTHVADDWAGDGDGEADAEDGVGDRQRVEVAITQKELTGDESPEQGDGSEDGVGQMSE